MNIIQERMSIIFNEWATRYAKDPSKFGKITDSDGNIVNDYGKNCAFYFDKIARELDAENKLPKLNN